MSEDLNPPPVAGTVDITNLVESLRSAWVDWAVAFIYGEEIAIPGMQWVALPIVADIDKAIIRELLNLLTKSAVMEAQFMDTAIRKASQAADFVDAVTAKNALPASATMEDFKRAEQNQMAAFRDFVTLSN